jgi:hypothetical protein
MDGPGDALKTAGRYAPTVIIYEALDALSDSDDDE